MKSDRNPLGGLGRRIGAVLARFRRDRRANVAIIFALALVPMMGVFGLAGEGSYWMLTQRGEQNAADAAVMAAAMAGQADFGYNSITGGSSACSTCYINEGKGVARNYGFTDGANNVTVAVANGQACPSNASSTVTGSALGNNICYKVTITKIVPLYFSPVIGFKGDATLNGAHAEQITAIAWAGPKDEPVNACVLALGTGGGTTNNAITLHGNPNAGLGDCTIFSDQSATCTGHNSGAFIGGAVGTDSNCGDAEYSHAANVADPYASLASNIPSNPCGTNTAGVTLSLASYTAASLATAIGLSATDTAGNTYLEVCGNLTLSSSVTLSSGNAIIVINNGILSTNGSAYTLSTGGAAGSTAAGMTLIYQGASSSTQPIDQAMSFNISGPTSGTWSGVTIYDPTATGDVRYAGNSPGWALTGIVYFPNAELDWRGAIGKSDSGFECFDLVVQTLLIDGTADMFSPDLSAPTSQCNLAGVTAPTTNIGFRYVLVE